MAPNCGAALSVKENYESQICKEGGPRSQSPKPSSRQNICPGNHVYYLPDLSPDGIAGPHIIFSPHKKRARSSLEPLELLKPLELRESLEFLESLELLEQKPEARVFV